MMPAVDENIIAVFLRAASQWPDAIALVHNEEQRSYAQLLEDVKATAAGLQQRGIGKGDTALVVVPMSIDLYRVVLALLYIGAIPVFLDAWVSRMRMADCLETVPCKALIAPRMLLWLAWLYPALRAIPVRTSPARLRATTRQGRPTSVRADDTALITFTTGSTGRPKAARRTHQSLQAQLLALTPLLPARQETSFTMLPIVVLIYLALGKTTILPPRGYQMKRARSIGVLHRCLQRHIVSSMVVSPSVMQLLCKLPPLLHLQHIVTGGGPVFPDLARAIDKHYANAKALVVYGSTEAEPISHLPMPEVAASSDTTLSELGLRVGIPDAIARVRIIKFSDQPISPTNQDAWDAMAQATGIAGEIVVAGPHVLREYIANDAAEARNKIKVAGTVWHRTGDAGRLDSNGRLYLLGRCAEVFSWQGQEYYPMITAYRIRKLAELKDAALCIHRDRPLLILLKSDQDKPGLAPILSTLGLSDASICYVKAIPKDPRHLTKIDWEALHSLVKDAVST